MQSSPLTILLTLKGRHLHTLRWIWHANRIRLPFHVVIADGEVNSIIANIMDNPSNFPDLSFEYHRYEDRSFTDYYRKCVDAISKVHTPYVMMSDNDDFLLPSGIFKSLDFLSCQTDYVSHSGRVGLFSINSRSELIPPNIIGALNSIGTLYHSYDLNYRSATERVRDAAMKYMPTSYNVHRTPDLRLILEEIASFGFGDLSIHEIFFAFRAMTLGKACVDTSSISYLRQAGTSSGFGCDIDWVRRIVSNSFMSDFQTMAVCLANAAAKADDADEVEVDKILRAAYAAFLRPRLTDHEEKLTFKRIIRRLLPDWLLKATREYSPPIPPRPKRRCLIEILQKAGASKEYLETFSLELRQIEETLEGQGFLDFVHSVVGKDLSPLY
jgi:glycosyltransferase domain-containing protein